jgi:hypothetical protein
MPYHSYLYALPPIQGDGVSIEALTSYVARLAAAHSVSTGDLLMRACAPRAQRQYLCNALDWGLDSFYTRAGALNGLGAMAWQWVTLLGELTSRRDLRPLTFLSWANVLTARMLLRETQAWCPACYDAWRYAHKRVYQPLLWTARTVTMCPIHRRDLVTRCPHPGCAQALTWLASNARPGWCHRCGGWLGETTAPIAPVFQPADQQALPVACGEDSRASMWQRERLAAAGAVARLLECGLSLTEAPSRVDLARSLRALIDEHSHGELAPFGRALGMPKNTVWGWVQQRNRPELEATLRIALACKVDVSDLLSGSIAAKGGSAAQPDAGGNLAPERGRARAPARRFDIVTARGALQRVLAERAHPAPTVTQLATVLGVDRRLLYRHCGEECRELGQRHRAEARVAVRKIIGAGRYPSRRRVAQRLRKPGYLRMPEVREAADAACAKHSAPVKNKIDGH